MKIEQVIEIADRAVGLLQLVRCTALHPTAPMPLNDLAKKAIDDTERDWLELKREYNEDCSNRQ